MPYRKLIQRELAALLSVLSHPERLAIVLELEDGERDVTSLCGSLAVSQSRASQHLALLRAHRIVTERRDGRHHHYRLTAADLPQWLTEGLRFMEAEGAQALQVQSAIAHTRELRAQKAKQSPVRRRAAQRGPA